MNIGNMIKKYRQQRELTQEQIAENLNVSVSAVSQWESGKTIPDVTTLLALANFFDITLDELFDRTSKDKERDIADYDRRAREYGNHGEIANQVALWREAVQKYPGDFHCLHELAYALHQTVYCGGDADLIQRNASEAIAICERILRDCKENYFRESAIQTLVQLYSFKEFPFASEKKAVEYALMAGSFISCREKLLEFAYFTDESRGKRVQLKHDNILNYMDSLCSNLCYGNYDTQEDKINACNAALTLWSTLIYDGNYQFYHCRIQKIYLLLAYCYANLQKHTETLESLKKALFHTRAYDNLPEGERNYTSVFIKLSVSNRASHSKNYVETNEETVKSHMKRKAFAFLHNDPDFLELVK